MSMDSVATSLSKARAARRFRAVVTARPPSGLVLREYLMGEAMQALGIPTTRALAAVATGEQVYRERPLAGRPAGARGEPVTCAWGPFSFLLRAAIRKS